MKTFINLCLTIIAIASLLVCCYVIREKVIDYSVEKESSYRIGYMHGYYDNVPEDDKGIKYMMFWYYHHRKALDRLQYRIDKDRTGEFDLILDFDLDYRIDGDNND